MAAEGCERTSVAFQDEDFVRRTLTAPSESCIYLVDKTQHGDIDAAMYLCEDQWATLAKDGFWNKHVAIVG